MYTLPRLSPARLTSRSCSLPACSLPSLCCLHHRTCCRTPSQRCPWSRQTAFGGSSGQRTSRQELPNDVAYHCLGPRHQRNPFSPRHKSHSLQSDPSSSHRHHFGSACHHRLAQDLFLRIYEPRPTPCPPQTRLRILGPRLLLRLPISKKHNPQQPLLLLVGTHTSLPARLSPHLYHPLAIHCKAPRRSFEPQHIYLARFRSVCGPTSPQFSFQNGLPRPTFHPRTPNEAFHY